MKSIFIVAIISYIASCSTLRATQNEQDILNSFKLTYGSPGAAVIIRSLNEEVEKSIPLAIIDGDKAFELTKFSVKEEVMCSSGEYAVLKYCKDSKCEYRFEEYLCFFGH